MSQIIRNLKTLGIIFSAALMPDLFVAEQVLAEPTSTVSLYDLSAQMIDGKTQPLSEYKGKVLLIVNTASRCGFTPQLGGLQEIYNRFKAQGFEVLAFPSNDFLGQEPGEGQEIKHFCESKYNTNFPLFAKAPVTGDEKQPVFKYLTEQANPEHAGPVLWNFEKFLIGRDGKLLNRWRSWTAPTSDSIVGAVEKALGAG